MPRWFTSTVFILFGFIQSVTGQQLPIRSYTPADGLPSSFIQHILSDSRGYLWISTRNGLARFDGYQFVTYSTENGLSHPTINHVLETRNGNYWVATNGGGLCRFIPNGGHEASNRTFFQCYPVGESVASNSVNYVMEDHSGRLWVGTDNGVFRMEPGSSKFRYFQLTSQQELSEYGFGVMAILEDLENTVWIKTTHAGLFRVLSDGHVLRNPWQAGDKSFGALKDQNGQIWMSAVNGVEILKTDRNAQKLFSLRNYQSVLGHTVGTIRSLLQTSDGLIWIATDNGLSCFDGKRFRIYTKSDGLTTHSLSALAEDKDGNLWIGSWGAGLMKFIRKGFLSYDQSGSNDFGPVHSITKGSDGQIYVVSGNWLIHRFEGEKFSTITLPIPNEFTHLWSSNVALLDSRGEWWAASDRGLLRFPKVNNFIQLKKSKARLYTAKDGLAGNAILRIYEDSAGDLWISTVTASRCCLTRWDRRTNAFYQIGEKDGAISDDIATSFLDDQNGNLWIGYYDYGGLVRYRQNTFKRFSTNDGLPKGMITSLYADRLGRLWIATNYGGLARVDRPTEEKLTFITYTKHNGLSTNDCRTITEDRWGRIYVGTVHGIDQLDPVSKKIHHYTMADGLNSDFITTAYADQKGELWFGTYTGLSRLKPQQGDLHATKLKVLLTNVAVAGSSYRLSELGEFSVSGIQLPHNRNQIQISFGVINFSLGENLRFQYKLEGADEDWNPPTEDRSVHYAHLNPGSYNFKVQALDESGVISVSPAMVRFTILKPIWLQWWFLTLITVSTALLIHSIYRIRMKRLLEMERLRTRIASDLHDDIGSSLSRIAVLSDAVGRRVKGEPGVVPLLANMSQASREAIDAMADIVWAVNPNKDHLQDLEKRMRHVAGEMLTEQDLEFYCASNEEQSYTLSPDFKRNVFLIFKECLNNVVRHSAASKVRVRLDLNDGNLLLEIQDNGNGFDFNQDYEGQGLKNIKKRASELNANLEVSSQPDNGAKICLQAHLHRGSFFNSRY